MCQYANVLTKTQMNAPTSTLANYLISQLDYAGSTRNKG